MSTIPQEYLNQSHDFGFTAVDDPDDYVPPPQPVVNTEEISGPILERLQNLEYNVGEILNAVERMQQVVPTGVDFDTDEYKALIEKDVKAKLKEVESLIMPLLVNLMKDSDTKEYIKWPNRKPAIESFIEKILAITRT